MSCFYCGDKVKTWRCLQCRADVGAACPECHGEVSHGVIPPREPYRDALTRRMEDRFPDDLLTEPLPKENE
jgi:hypothetical protein